jgi:tripartite-type tricarboxylate transporter receptor subunit TctC
MRSIRALFAAAAAFPLLVAAAFAQDFPQRPIRLIVPYGPGGITDITARAIAPKMGEILGQSVVVENKPGGAAIPGFDLVAKSPADGYTMVLATNAFAANLILFRKLPYDAQKDFAPVTLVSTVPTVLVVHPGVQANSVSELIAAAKANPGKLNYGSAGNGSDNHLTAEVFNHAVGISVQHVPYKGGGAVMTDLMGGRVDYVFAVLPTAYPFITSGKLKALAVTSARRNPALPDVPTIAEAVLPGFNVNAWLGLFVPAATPPAIVDKLNAAAVKAVQSPDVTERLTKMGVEVVGSTPAAMASYLASELNRWTTLAKQVKFEVAE